MRVTVFYSWQSDLPNNTNRGFIHSVIEKAIQTIKRDEAFDLDICLERDTQGEPGAPNIVTTILQKIDDCDIFIADISIVTCEVKDGQRFSPNPNVMIELGYAIKSVGWDRIILFCNEHYGTGDKLPFDIQQYRRIGYKLAPEEDKSAVRERLAKVCRTALEDITQNFYKTKKGNIPNLTVDWWQFNLIADDNELPPITETKSTTDVLDLTRSRAIDKTITDIELFISREREEVNKIDGRFDPKWDRKVEDYTKACDDFINQIKSQQLRRNYFLHVNSANAVKVTLNLHNVGNSPASEISIRVTLPEWILVFDKLPDEDKIPKRPKKPSPDIFKSDIFSIYNSSLLANAGLMSAMNRFNPVGIPRKRTSACYIKDNDIIMWADRLPHKHELTIEDDCFYILAMPESKPGEHALKAKLFCVEYDDWEETDLFIRINP